MALESSRRSARVLLKVPIEVKGNAVDGSPFEEKTSTKEVNGHGAQIVLHQALRSSEPLAITNLQNRKSCPFRVVRLLEKSAEGALEYGVECLRPEDNIWGIYFPEMSPASSLTEKRLIDALLECGGCGFREMAQLTFNQFRILGERSVLERKCMRCGQLTEWGYGYVEEEEAPPAGPKLSSNTPPLPGGIERRKSRRVPVKLPVRVRLDDGQEDVARTENLSKTGVRFISNLKMNVGDMIHLTVGYAEPGGGIEVEAQVVSRQENEGGTAAIYGVRVEEFSQSTSG